MTAPVQKKFREEFEEKFQEKKPKSGCFGFLNGRKVKKEEEEKTYFSPLCRSPHIGSLDILNKEYIVK